jgi:bifunctional DNase/RNase
MGHDTAVEMFVGGLVMDPATQAPIVVLKDESGSVTLPIWIGMAEATSIASAIKQVTMARPLTHDLMYDLLLDLGVTVQRVVITELKDSTYFAELVLAQGDKVLILDARPSDAIALSLRASAPVYVAQQVLDQAKVAFAGSSTPSKSSDDVPVGGDGGGEAGEEGDASAQGAPSDEGSAEGAEGEIVPEDDQSSDFRAIDKDKWEEILSQLDPDDFKYKV